MYSFIQASPHRRQFKFSNKTYSCATITAAAKSLQHSRRLTPPPAAYDAVSPSLQIGRGCHLRGAVCSGQGRSTVWLSCLALGSRRTSHSYHRWTAASDSRASHTCWKGRGGGGARASPHTPPHIWSQPSLPSEMMLNSLGTVMFTVAFLLCAGGGSFSGRW